MKRYWIALVFFTAVTQADTNYPKKDGTGFYVLPTSGISQPGDAGNIERSQNISFVSNTGGATDVPVGCETPASVACVYGLTPFVQGCPINGSLPTDYNSRGANTIIAVVEAGDNSDQLNDLQQYSLQFGLLAPTLRIYRQTCVLGAPAMQYAQDEHVLDIEMIHAMAPAAVIDEVEADSNASSDMRSAVACASSLVQQASGGFVSYSYGGVETANETANDSSYQVPGAIMVVSSGDNSAPARYPASSPDVIGAGGISILRDANRNFIGEGSWSVNVQQQQLGEKSGGSGGPSLYELRPPFQFSIRQVTGSQRGTPDFSADADPDTGVCVYSTYAFNNNGKYWIKDGGTSAAAPALSGIMDVARSRSNTCPLNASTTTQNFLMCIYGHATKNYATNWRDIRSGNNGYPTRAGYDFVTGLGAVIGYTGK